MATNNRKNICIQYKTGKKVTRNNKEYDETRLLTVGSAFVNDFGDKGETKIDGHMRAIPPNWDGRFILFDAPDKDNNGDESIPF